MHRRTLTLLIALGGVVRVAASQSPVVRADGPPAWGSGVRLVPLGVLGTLNGPPEYALASVRLFAATGQGDFYLYDGQATQVRHYAADGTFLRNIGREGSGPGEYRDLLGLALDGDSLLVTWDPRNRRVTYFGTDGTLRRSFLPRIPSVLFGADVFEVDAQRRVIIQVDAREETNVYLRFAPDGSVIDTLRGSTAGEQGFMVNSPEGARYTFVRKLLAKPTPLGGLLRGSTGTLGFTVDVAGRTRTVERRTPEIPLDPVERAEWERVVTVVNTRPNRGSAPLLRIPGTKPAMRGFFGDRDGRVWLDTYTRAEVRAASPAEAGRARITRFERATFEVFGVNGRYLGRIVLPVGHALLAARGDCLWTYTSGPDDEIRVAFYRIVTAAGQPVP